MHQTLISSEELVVRRHAVENALATLALEGLMPSPEAIAVFERYRDGLITLDQMDSAIDVLLDRRSVHLS